MQTETQTMKKRRWPKAVLILGVLTYLVFRVLEFCSVTGGVISGVVTDAETGEPIEGAIVITNWVGVINVIVDSQTTCYWTQGTVTDKSGRFRFSRWWSMEDWKPLFDRRVSVYAYKSGYHPRHSPRFDVFDIPMEPNRDAYDERFAELKKLVPRASCHGANNGEKELYPFYKAMAEDAAKYATTYEERKAIPWFQEIAAGKLVETYRDMTGKEYDEQLKKIMEKGLP